MTLRAIVPAAGRGSRLGLDRPKILAPLGGGDTVWTLLRRRLLAVADRVHVVLAPDGLPVFRDADPARFAYGRVTLGVQDAPRGMGDAVFGARAAWADAADLLVVWGDQAGLSEATLRRAAAAHAAGHGPRLTVPLVELDQPYVEYLLGPDGRLERILQSREGDVCARRGLGDCGCFLLSTDGLADAWDAHAAASVGAATGELNLLPFLTALARAGWGFRAVPVDDPAEARGINTPTDLDFFRHRLASAGR